MTKHKYLKDERVIYTKKSFLGKSDFDREFWKKVPINDKFSATWQLMIDAMIIKGTPEKLKIKKIIKVKNLDGKVIKEINLENKNSYK